MIKIGKQNGKTGPSFSIPEGQTCPGKTKTCASLCYVLYDCFAWSHVKGSRARNFKTILELLKAGKLSDTLSKLFRKQRTLRIHDSGDFFSPSYTREVRHAVALAPDTTFWAYTRSWSVPAILAELVELAKESNMALWLSADIDNWVACVACLKANPSFAGIAFLQTEGTEQPVKALSDALPKGKFVNFPLHKHRGKLKVPVVTGAFNCPAVTRAIPHDRENPACLKCNYCLPERIA